MDGTEVTFLGGLVLGLASTLHCSAMCGAISCSALLSLGPATAWGRFWHAVLLNAGRIATYAALGIAASLAGSMIIKPETTMNFRVLQYIAAAVLMWTGLAMAGMMPRLALLDTAMTRLSGAVATATRPIQGTAAAPLGLGVVWGLNPCPMVYAALFTATLTASAWGGLSVMTGFGLGTLPGVLTAGFGLASLRNIDVNRTAQIVAGLLIALAGFASLYVPAAHIAAWCLN
ncbi:MAG: sulfite exporter TauE/SafE family protein [Hyphomicrobium sp.]|jgi:sulfite exporter TauE/SafE|nr:sulfite exporter TauE/SafE family protein [Hyphomonas sp.]MCU0954114.1 sulfite exporter TauE/SafE family protein [Hyphomicrobium sp.]